MALRAFALALLFASALGVHAQGTICVNPTTLPGLEGWWPLDEASGSTAQDLSILVGSFPNPGTTMQGALGAANSPSAVPGLVFGAYDFPGFAANPIAYVDVPSHPTLNFGTGSFSADAWVRVDFPVQLDLYPIVAKYETATGSAVGFDFLLNFLGAGQFRFILYIADGSLSQTIFSNPFTLTGTSWVFSAFSVDRSANQVSFFGGPSGATLLPLGTFPLTVTGSVSNAASVYFGRSPVHNDWPLLGGLDEPELFRAAVPPPIFQALYNADALGKCRKILPSEEPSEPPDGFRLEAPRPNPSAGQTTLTFVLPEAAHVRLSVYDVRGREVAVLVDGLRSAGTHHVVWDPRRVPAGVYAVRLAGNGLAREQRVTVAK
ncbi:MAG TPA: T9SS type A sorting domain-containing protein [Rubricoccaceae bacterium]|nr:T9SS type A sorting domain-containing protein [Rubricoccaceae bacterium]